MFSVNNFYDYLTHQYGWPNKNNKNFVYIFNQHGDRNLWNLVALCDSNLLEQRTNSLSINQFYSRIYLLDQEPLNFELFEINHITISDDRKKWFDEELYEIYSQNLPKRRQFTTMLSTFNASIVCHSELNSAEVKLLEQHGFICCYYFYHGLISRDWFRHWKHYILENNTNTTAQRFGIYARDASGTRSYRLDVLDSLLPVCNRVYFKIQPTLQKQITNQQVLISWNSAEVEYDSDASATINLQDCDQFQIQIVLETLFDTDKIYLTEKIFKPMVMKQPFILFAGPGSLKYLKRYGFKTFDSLWNEDYDDIADSKTRYQKIIELVYTLNGLSSDDFNELINKAKQITEHNHRHFYSEEFEKQLLDELHQNMSAALEEQNTRALTFDGSVWFDQIDFLYQKTGMVLPRTKRSMSNILKYLTHTEPTIAEKIIEKYGHLF